MKSSLMRGNKCSKRERGGGEERDSERTIEGGRERERKKEREKLTYGTHRTAQCLLSSLYRAACPFGGQRGEQIVIIRFLYIRC